ncbi:hypothetical protein MMC22_001635 [Lobaria immixta]|nr:hypothetical protein [Lobaria immixta]
MRSIQCLSSSVVSTSFTSGYKGIVLAWSISGSRASFNELLLRRDIFSPNGENNFALIGHQDLAIEPGEEENPSGSQPEQQPAPEPAPEPNPQPGPAPEPVPEPPIRNPLPKPQPVRIDPSQPGVNVPVPVEPSQPQAPGNLPPVSVPVGVPIVPLPIPIVPLPIPIVPQPTAGATTSPVPRRPRGPRPVPISGFDGGYQPVPQTSSIILRGPDVSDYPSDAQIRQDILRIPRDATVMYTEIGGLFPVRLFAEQFDPPKLLYTEAFPYGYTWQNDRSPRWYQDFIDRLCAILCDLTVGTVYLVSKFPYGPEFPCSVWNRIEYRALQANIDVNEIILVDHTNINRQRPFWNTQHGEIGPNFQLHRKRETNVAPCPDADGISNGYDVPATAVTDLTPIIGAAAGWASVDIMQHRSNYPDLRHMLDVSILDATGKEIRALNGVMADPGQEVVVWSPLPFALRIIASASDDDPLQFKYGQLSWDSDDQSMCTFDPWKSEIREGICNFNY